MTTRVKPQRQALNPGHPRAKGLVGAWPIWERGGTLLRDLTRRNHGSLITGAAWTRDRYGPALSLDGATGYVQVPHTAALMPADGLSLAILVKATSVATFDTLIGKSSSSGWTDGYGLFWNGANILRFWVNVWDGAGTVQTTLTPTAWNHILATYDRRELRLYVNGALAGTAAFTAAITGNTAPLEIGRGQTDAQNLHGLIADAKLWGRGLTVREALSERRDPWALYRPRILPHQSPFPPVRRYWARLWPDPRPVAEFDHA